MLGESTEKKSQTSPLQGFLLTQGILGKSKGAMLAGRVSSLLKVFWGESKGSMLARRVSSLLNVFLGEDKGDMLARMGFRPTQGIFGEE